MECLPRTGQVQNRKPEGNDGHFSVDFTWISRESTGTDLILYTYIYFTTQIEEEVHNELCSFASDANLFQVLKH